MRAARAAGVHHVVATPTPPNSPEGMQYMFISTLLSAVPEFYGWTANTYAFQFVGENGTRGMLVSDQNDPALRLEGFVVSPAYIAAADAAMHWESPAPVLKTSPTKQQAKLAILARSIGIPPRACNGAGPFLRVFVNVDNWLCGGRYPAYGEVKPEAAALLAQLLGGAGGHVREVHADVGHWGLVRVCLCKR
jgi:hypothetical protein